MIDIHCHLLYGVDDGAQTIEESVAMLKVAREQGVQAMILTPHYRHGMFAYPTDTIEEHFEKLKLYADSLGIQIFLGCEYHVNSQITQAFDAGRCHTLADTKYVLTEYSHQSEFSYIHKMTEELILHGYIPVIAHVERYRCMVENLDLAAELQDMGAMIQMNADAILGLEGWGSKRYCKKMLQEELVDLVASDSHGIAERVSHMRKCYDAITKKFGEDYAESLMHGNPIKILE